MRKLIFILLFPTFLMSQVNMWTYDTANGGNNNGIIEANEMQSAIDNESDLIVSPLTTITTTVRIDLDQSFSHNIDWNGSILSFTGNIIALQVDKRGSGATVTVMRDLTIDGNLSGQHGVKAYSKCEFYNVDVIDIKPTSDGANGYQTLVYNEASSYGNWVFEGCDVIGVSAELTNNGSVAGSGGNANGWLLQTEAIPTTQTTVTVRDSNITNIYGEDACSIFTHDRTAKGGANTLLDYEIDNVTITGWERRAIKGFNGGITYRNMTVYVDDVANATSTTERIFMSLGSGSSSAEVYDLKMLNCDFIGRVSGAMDSRIIVASCSGIEISNCTFTNGVDLLFTYNGSYPYPIDNVSICNTSFGTGSIIDDYSVTYAGNDVITLDTDNSYADGIGTTVKVSSAYWQQLDLSCPPEVGSSPGIGGGNSSPNALKNETSGMLIAN